MTVHIAFSNANAALLASDSQGSGDESKSHGWQKQFAGPDFLVGVAGDGAILEELFGRMYDAVLSGPDALNSRGVKAFIEDFVARELQPQAKREIEIVLVMPPDPRGEGVHIYRPESFTRMDRPSDFGVIGSGAVFVLRACQRYRRLGIAIPLDEMADLVVAAEDFAAAADESLAVDESFLLGIAANNRAYLMGDGRIELGHAPAPLRQQWAEAARRFRAIMAKAEVLNGSLLLVQKELAAVRTGKLTQRNLDAVKEINDSMPAYRQDLERQIQEYFIWYDQLLGR